LPQQDDLLSWSRLQPSIMSMADCYLSAPLLQSAAFSTPCFSTSLGGYLREKCTRLFSSLYYFLPFVLRHTCRTVSSNRAPNQSSSLRTSWSGIPIRITFLTGSMASITRCLASQWRRSPTLVKCYRHYTRCIKEFRCLCSQHRQRCLAIVQGGRCISGRNNLQWEWN